MDFSSIMGSMGGSSGGGTGGQGNTGIPYLDQLLPLIRSGFQSTEGMAMMAYGKMVGKEAEAARPPLTDAGQMSTLAMLKHKAATFAAGTGYTAEKALVEQQAAATRRAISQNSGGDVGMTISALAKSQMAASTGLNQVLAGAQERERYYMNTAIQQENMIAQRKLELQLLKHSQLKAKEASLMQGGMSSFNSGMMMT